MNNSPKIYIDPTICILFSSFYIKGLYEVFGKKNVSFSTTYFKELRRREESHSFDQYMAFVVISPDQSIKKIIIDYRDKPSVKESAYAWCDCYAKININSILTDKKFHDKLISIGPEFPVRIWNIWETIYHCAFNFMRCRFSPIVSLRAYLLDYYRQYTRLKLEYLLNIPRNDNNHYDEPYIFMSATLWEHKNCLEGTNLQRKKFIDVCKGLKCHFEGGFIASKNHPQYTEFKYLILNRPYSIRRYIKKTKQSVLVFNNPAVHNCHGWKLGEYLGLGKAIISTPMSNLLPEALVHGKNVHFIYNDEDFTTAIQLLLKDHGYRKHLEDNAKAYYWKYIDPRSIIENVCFKSIEKVEPLV